MTHLPLKREKCNATRLCIKSTQKCEFYYLLVHINLSADSSDKFDIGYCSIKVTAGF